MRGRTEAAASTFAVFIVAVGSGVDGLRRQLSGFLDLAGRRRDPLVSVGCLGDDLVWVLERAVPYDVRALPRYPAQSSTSLDADAIVRAVMADVHRDLSDGTRLRPPEHSIVIFLWAEDSVPVRGAAHVASWLDVSDAIVDLAVHCVPRSYRAADWRAVPASARSYLLARNGNTPVGLLAHCGQLFHGWSAFAAVPPGLSLTDLDGPP